MQVQHNAQSIVVNLDHYLENIEAPDPEAFEDLKGDELVNDETQTEFRSLVGNLVGLLRMPGRTWGMMVWL